MNERPKLFSFFAWFTGAARNRKNTVKWVGSCASCRIPLEKLQPMFRGGARQTCQVCRGMIEAAKTRYLQTVQDQYLEEQKRKKILLPGGNYLS